MLNKLTIIAILLSLIVLQSCYVDNVDTVNQALAENERQIQDYLSTNGLNATKTTSGAYYAITQSSTGETVEDGDSIYVHFKATLVSGEVVDTTWQFKNRPDKYLVGINGILFANGQAGVSNHLVGLEEGIKKMKEGEKAKIIIPSNLALGGNGTNKVPPFSVLVYDITLEKVIGEEELIENYIAEKMLNVTQKTDSNLRYIKVLDGISNTKPVNNQELIVNYKGTLLNGTQFDANQDSTFAMILGRNQVIKGWEQGLKLINREETAILIIPSALAYGANGVLNQQTRTYNIPPYAPLVFEVRHTKTQKTRILDYIKLNAWTDTVRTNSGLYTRVEAAVPETNRKAVETDSVQVRITAHYLMTNEVLSAPFFTNQVIDFRLNKSEADTNNKELIAGLREGIILMREGERRRLIIPSGLAFGEKGKAGKPVPGKTPVVYIVELVKFF